MTKKVNQQTSTVTFTKSQIKALKAVVAQLGLIPHPIVKTITVRVHHAQNQPTIKAPELGLKANAIPQEDQRRTVGVAMTPGQYQRLSAHAQRLGWSRSRAMVAMMTTYFEKDNNHE
jgi:hypothetical protein